jgi:hypothetical protein
LKELINKSCKKTINYKEKTMIQKTLLALILLTGGFFAGQNLEQRKDRQLIDHALYTCSKQNKVEVTLREMEDGSCSFMAMGAE